MSKKRSDISNIVNIFECAELKDIRIGDNHIFSDMTTYQIDRLATVLDTANFNKEIISGIVKWAKLRVCCGAREFFCYAEYFCSYIFEETRQLENDYEAELKVAKSVPGFKRHAFDQKRGIIGARRKYFKDQVIKGLNANDSQLTALNEHYMNMCRLVKPFNEVLSPRFVTEHEAAYHYFKHRRIGPTNTLSMGDSVEMAAVDVARLYCGINRYFRYRCFLLRGDCLHTYIDTKLVKVLRIRKFLQRIAAYQTVKGKEATRFLKMSI